MTLFLTIIFWIIIVALFAFSFIGIVVPVIPGAPLILGGFAVYHFFIAPIEGVSFWIAMFILAAVSVIVDYLASIKFVQKWGGSKKSQWAAIIGLLIGPFIMGPLGLIVMPFALVVLVEMIIGSNARDSFKVGLASFIGLLSGGLFKALIFIAMIIYFFIKI